MTLSEILQFLHEVEKLKCELRHSWLSNGRRESVSDHTWRVALMVILLSSKLDKKINTERALKMAIIHDINEAYIGDVHAFAPEHAEQKNNELKNIQTLLARFSGDTMQEIHDLWIEYEDQKSIESKFIKALDKIEVRLQHNEADIATWIDPEFPRSQFTADKYCQFDDALQEFNELIKKESREKIQKESDRDIEVVTESAKNMKSTY